MREKGLVWEIDSKKPIPVKIRFESYRVNGTLAVMMCGDDDFQEVITVNLPESVILPEQAQFVDTNNFPGIDGWLEANDIATPLGFSAQSGFCSYPAYYFRE